MPKQRLTAKNIGTLKAPSAGQIDYFDDILPGFALRVTAHGARSYCLLYRFDGELRRYTIGAVTKFSLASAREIARGIFAAVSEGRDPREEKKEHRREAIKARDDLYAGAVEDFIKNYSIGKKGNRSWKEQRRLLLKANERWQERPVSSITKRDVSEVLDRLVAAGRGYTANRTYEVLATFFKWLDQRDRIPENFMAKVAKPFEGEKARERTWKDTELKAIWKAADKLDGDETIYLRLLLLLGQRRDEIAGMRWDELDLEAATWRLPVARAKGKRVHVFPLPSLAVRMLKSLPRVKDNPFVFPGRGTRQGEPSPMTVGSKIQAKVQEESGIADFTFHDARRTFRTGLDALKIPPHIKDECLNHARRGVGDVHYSQYDYLDEQREAFDAWQDHIAKLVYPKGVVGLRG